MGEIRIRRGRAKPLWRGHPWVFADSVDSIGGSPRPGDLCTIKAPDGRTIGCGFYSPKSAIVARVLSNEETIPPDFFERRLRDARALREEVLNLPMVTDGYRLVMWVSSEPVPISEIGLLDWRDPSVVHQLQE